MVNSNTSLRSNAPQVEFVLRHRLSRVAGQLRALAFHRSGLRIWSVVSAFAAALIVLSPKVPAIADYAAPALLVVFVVASSLAAWLAWRDRSDVFTAARHLEQRFPELRSALQAAVEQRPEPEGQFGFLQRRVINDVLRHAETHDWIFQPRRAARWYLLGHAIALLAALSLSIVVIQAHRPGVEGKRALARTGIEVTPGDTQVERGSAVVIAARFGSDMPGTAELVAVSGGAASIRYAMHRSLSDPVFAFTLTPVNNDVSYHVEYDNRPTRTFVLRVFDRPALLRADADLDYPTYTGLAHRHVVDTRRVSAVVGTKLQYDFFTNKPLARATLKGPENRTVTLAAIGPGRTQFRLESSVTQSERFTLVLEDDDGRTNGSPIDVRIEALENRRPDLKLLFPRGDQHVSPLEEMHFQAEARDDFGLRDYGLGLSVGDAAPNYVSFAKPSTTPVLQAAFDHVLALESLGVKADQLVTWFAWADDVGPDGEIRRTSSDVYFAQVRRLDEIFKEDANGGGAGQNGGGGPGEELLEAQRQISIATWKLRQTDAAAAQFATDAGTLRDSQAQLQQQLRTLRAQLEDPRMTTAADEAAKLMDQAHDALGEAASNKTKATLDAAWSASRGAYQALLRMQPRDTRVSQSRSASQGGSRGRNREQLNELDFRNENDRYETETQAQPPATPEQREQLGVLARLRELARRQQDLNGRLQELQTALAAAEDEAKREAIRRELKRLEEEQRRMLSEVDEARQRVDKLQPGEQTQQVRQQLEQTREDMRRASEQLGQGEVSSALAAGSRARDKLQQTSEDLRKGAAGRFGEQMREARRQARELNKQQQDVTKQLNEMNRGQQSLDDSDKRESLAKQLQEQAQRRESLMQNLRQVTDESEGNEPRLHRQLYDLLRQQQQSGAGNELGASAELLRRGFVAPAQERQAGVQREFEQLQRSVERAAGAVLGDETNELRFAQNELDELGKELQRDRSDPTGSEGRSAAAGEPDPKASTPGNSSGEQPGEGKNGESPSAVQSSEKSAREPGEQPGTSAGGKGTTAGNEGTGTPSPSSESGQPSRATAGSGSPTPGQPGSGGTGGTESPTSLEEFARSLGGNGGSGERRGPLTGGGFGEWAERLRTVEELLESPEQRQQLAGARAQAEELRRANQRDGQAPRWDLVEIGVVKPLQEARAWLRQELNRREEPDALHPIDRDPVPERYAESVRKYYEALGSDKAAP
ncbi:MAG: hypothetical protein ABIZ04_06330 [Opitutus sp.]